jgi:hypothetical protein
MSRHVPRGHDRESGFRSWPSDSERTGTWRAVRRSIEIRDSPWHAFPVQPYRARTGIKHLPDVERDRWNAEQQVGQRDGKEPNNEDEHSPANVAGIHLACAWTEKAQQRSDAAIFLDVPERGPGQGFHKSRLGDSAVRTDCRIFEDDVAATKAESRVDAGDRLERVAIRRHARRSWQRFGERERLHDYRRRNWHFGRGRQHGKAKSALAIPAINNVGGPFDGDVVDPIAVWTGNTHEGPG